MVCDYCDNFCTSRCSGCRQIVDGEVKYTHFDDVLADGDVPPPPPLQPPPPATSSEPISSEKFDLGESGNAADTAVEPPRSQTTETEVAAKTAETAVEEADSPSEPPADAASTPPDGPKRLEYAFSNGVIFNESCMDTMERHIAEKSVDIILTSPPYCTSNRGGRGSAVTLATTNANPKFYPYLRYDVFSDNLGEDEYVDWTVKLFGLFDRVLKKDGCVLYNISYSSTRRDMLFLTIAAILERTQFSLADMIGWKKRTALPNNLSPNKLTRIFEPVFVFARKDEMDTFTCNKKVTSVREKTGQKMYENVYNFIEAPNNDGSCSLNKATYSSELCEKLLTIYGRGGMCVYDPFMGTGTTAVACKRLGMTCYGSELSPAQCEYAVGRIDAVSKEDKQ